MEQSLVLDNKKKSYAPVYFEPLTKEEIEEIENQSSQSKSSSERTS